MDTRTEKPNYSSLAIFAVLGILISAGWGYLYGGGQYLRSHHYRHPYIAWGMQIAEDGMYLMKMNEGFGRSAQQKLAMYSGSIPGYDAAIWKYELQTGRALSNWDYIHWSEIYGWLNDQYMAREKAKSMAGFGAFLGLVLTAIFISLSLWERSTRDRRKLARKTKSWFLWGLLQIKCAGVPLPEKRDYSPNILISGRMGSGKSSEEDNVITQWREAGRSAVIIDYKNEKIQKFYHQGDLILNPFITRSVRYAFKADAKDTLEQAAMGEAFFPPSDHPVHNHFQIGGRQIMQEILRLCDTNSDMWRLVHDRAELVQRLKRTPARVYLEAGTDEAASHVTSLMANFAVIQHFQAGAGPDDFGARSFVRLARKAPGPFLWVPLSEKQRPALAPFLSVFAGIIISEILDQPDALPEERLLLGLDEIGQIPVVDRLGAALTAGRKPGIFILAAAQHANQIARKYGNEWKEIFGGFGTKLVLGQPDADGAEFWSRELGVQEVKVKRKNWSQGESGTTRGWTESDELRPRVRADELRALPNLRGYIQVSHHPAVQVKIKINKCPNIFTVGPSWNRTARDEPSAGEVLRNELSRAAASPVTPEPKLASPLVDLDAFGAGLNAKS